MELISKKKKKKTYKNKQTNEANNWNLLLSGWMVNADKWILLWNIKVIKIISALNWHLLSGWKETKETWKIDKLRMQFFNLSVQ